MKLQDRIDILQSIVDETIAKEDLARTVANNTNSNFNETLLQISMNNIEIAPEIAKELLLALIIENTYSNIELCLN